MNKRSLAIARLVILACLTLFLLHSLASVVQQHEEALRRISAKAGLDLDGSAKVLHVKGRDVVYHLVSSPEPRAVLFMAHGCNHWAFDFAYPSKSCPDCTGLPVEMRLVQMALERGFVPIAISSHAGQRSCWSSSDGPEIAALLQYFMKEMESMLSTLPLFALGASSGGTFVSALPAHIELQGVCLQISGLRMNAIELLSEQGKMYPPTLDIYMSSPPFSARGVQALHARGVAAHAVKAAPIPITESFFVERIRGFELKDAQALVQGFRDANLLDSQNFLIDDPRQSKWRGVVKRALPGVGDTLLADQSAISELLNVAYCKHEITAEHMEQTLTFFESLIV